MTVWVNGIVVIFQIFQHIPVFAHPLGICFYPGSKFSFLFLLLIHHFQVFNGIVHPDAVFPVVGAAGIFACIRYVDCLVGQHIFFPNILFCTPNFDAGFISVIYPLIDAPRAQVSLGRARISQNHGVIAILITLIGNGYKPFRAIGYVIFGVFSRFTIGCAINPKYRKVAGMTRIHPVICFAAKFSDRRWRCIGKPNIIKSFVNE